MSQCVDHHLRQMMAETLHYCRDHVKNGGIPFSAYILNDAGDILGRGVNRVREHHDPTAHAEVDAIRDACFQQGVPYLTGAILLASGEPCAMCYMSALYAGVSRIYYAVDRDEAAAHGFDYRGGYDLFANDPTHWRAPRVEKLVVDGALEPFQDFHRVRMPSR
ncbi:nucleoside deaminase [Woodsholea maritima]|uniref:nucleoside deaminase n=1 Tax=Woodsholea maritima TaxID=240237 RepID=UPI0003669FD7|nr:nucleoside deaminase [Woodsholea maritima]